MGTDTDTEESETDSESMDINTDTEDTDLEHMGKQDQQGTTFFLNFTFYHVNFCPIHHLHYLK